MKSSQGIFAVIGLYAVVAIAGFAANSRREIPIPKEPKKPMNEPLDWPIALPTVTVPAKPKMPWLLVHEYVKGPAMIKIEAKGSWFLSDRANCTADGEFTSSLKSQGCLLDTAPSGALIAKIGGSSAGATDGKVFLAGSFTVYEIGADVKGPLYLTINDAPSCLSDNRGELEVEIHIRPLPTPNPPTPPAG